jgi:hypothetical protein
MASQDPTLSTTKAVPHQLVGSHPGPNHIAAQSAAAAAAAAAACTPRAVRAKSLPACPGAGRYAKRLGFQVWNLRSCAVVPVVLTRYLGN